MTNMSAATELAQQTAGLSAEALVQHVTAFLPGRIAQASSLGAEDQVLTDMLCRLTDQPRVFTLDTGRLAQETHDTIAATNRHYNIRIKVLSPDAGDLEALVGEHGPNCFYDSVDLRQRCCAVRKVQPLRRELATLDAWITGLRREQSVTRLEVAAVEWDEANGLVKVNPLADWSSEQVWDYIRAHSVPYNALHDRGYPSIGCAPCTRAVAPGQDVRSGRWWWEEPQQRECGLHVVNGKLIREGLAQRPRGRL